MILFSKNFRGRDFLCFLLSFYFQINSRVFELHVIGNCLPSVTMAFFLFCFSSTPTVVVRSWRVNGIDGRYSMKAIDVAEFQSARKPASRLDCMVKSQFCLLFTGYVFLITAYYYTLNLILFLYLPKLLLMAFSVNRN